MPEGHSLHRLAHAFRAGFLSENLTVTSPQGRFADGAALVDGATLVAAEAWGKHLLLGFGNRPGSDVAHWLHVHLGLNGAWTFAGDEHFRGPHAIGAPRIRVGETETVVDDGGTTFPPSPTSPSLAPPSPTSPWEPPEPRGQVRARILGRHGVADLTGPTRCEVLGPDGFDQVVARLGPDPLQPDPDGRQEQRFVDAVRRSRSSAGVLLMDQSVLAGVGNIYRAELLFRARVHPLREGASLAPRTVRAIWRDAVVLMTDGVRQGRIVTTAPEDRHAPADQWYVYHRDGRPCLRCGRTVSVADLAGRRVYWCSTCQRKR